MPTSNTRVPFRNRLGFRIGLGAFVVLFLGEALFYPFWEWLEQSFTEWGNPEFVRAYADYLEGKPTAEASQFNVYVYLNSPFVVFAGIAYVMLTASIFATFVSFLATRRLKKLTKQVAAAPDSETGLSGPFHVGGSDEISFLATNMNAMRDRIEALLEQAGERDRLRTEWVSHVSHDLRTPLMALTAVVSRCRSLLELPPEEMVQEITPLLAAAALDTRRIRDLAEDLLEMARLEVSPDVPLESVPPGELLRSVIQELTPIAQSRGVRLDFYCPTEAIELQADGRRLIRAVENITLNSLQHADTVVRLSVRQRDSWLDILIEDDGPGLPEQEGQVALKEIGRDASRRDSAGIGLEVAQRIVATHGGDITAKNLAHGGARVVISLPLSMQGPLESTP